MEEKWIAYSESGRHVQPSAIKLAGEPVWSGLKHSRPATAVEIDAEKARRAREEAGRRVRAEFDARADVVHAKAVHGYLEHSLEYVIDAFTPDEWLKLAETLRTQYERTRKD